MIGGQQWYRSERMNKNAMDNKLATFHHSLAGKDLGSEAADVITKNLFQRIDEVASRRESQNEQWEKELLTALRLCEQVKLGTQSAQAYALAIIEDNWDDMSMDFRKEYNYQFAVLVLRETGVQPSTMDNYTRAARVFFLEDHKPLGKVEVTKYDEYKRPVVRDGTPVKELQDFDPSRVPISKLSLMAPLARQEKMTAVLWNMLADNEVTVDALKKVIYKKEDDDDDEDPSLRYTMEGNRIIAHEFGERVEIGEIYFDMGESDLGRTAIRRLLLALSIPYEEDVITRMIQNARNNQLLRIYENGGEALIVDGNHNDNQGASS